MNGKVGDAFILSLGYGNELLHLAVWDNDWDVLAAFGAGAVLQEIGALLQCLDILFCGVDEDEIVYGRNHLSAFCPVVSFNESLCHRYKALDVFPVEVLFGNEFPTVRGAHGKPDSGVLFIHDDS